MSEAHHSEYQNTNISMENCCKFKIEWPTGTQTKWVPSSLREYKQMQGTPMEVGNDTSRRRLDSWEAKHEDAAGVHNASCSIGLETMRSGVSMIRISQ
jgi:hypothetical protein